MANDYLDDFLTPVKQLLPYIVYVKTNSDNYITAVDSSAFLTDTTDWVEIDSGYGDKYHHAQGNYFLKFIYTMDGAYRYKLVDGKPVECTAEEIAIQEEANKITITNPSTLENRVSALENTVNTTVAEYNTVLQELGVET